MIHANTKSEHTLRWKKILAASYCGNDAIETHLSASEISIDELKEINRLFPIQVPQQLFERTLLANNKQVLRQYLPNAQELIADPDYSNNPVGDVEATIAPGIIKKYKNRVLLVTTNVCPIHCRYCFRKNYAYAKGNPNSHGFRDAIQYCKQDTSINEVILSGGDPLSLEDEVLANLFFELEKIEHIDTIRLHTKYPSIIPERITPALLKILQDSNLNKVMVFHINHPDEITEKFCAITKKIKLTNTQLLNQSVLLNGVNSEATLLQQLSKKLFNAGVLPYYLHMLDHALGTKHFYVSDEKANEIVTQLKALLPGYLVPKLAKEAAGEPNKIY